jgi:hypothetical protein
MSNAARVEFRCLGRNFKHAVSRKARWGPSRTWATPATRFAMQLALGLTELWRVLRPDENRLLRRASRVLRTHQGR